MQKKVQIIQLALDKPQVVITTKGVNDIENTYLSVKGQGPSNSPDEPGDFDFGTELSVEAYAAIKPGITTMDSFTDQNGFKTVNSKQVGFLKDNLNVVLDVEDMLQDGLRNSYIRLISPTSVEMSPL